MRSWRLSLPGLSWGHPRQLVVSIYRYVNCTEEPALVPWRPRLAVALLIGALAALFAYHQLVGRHWLASDFEYDLRAARRLLAGLDPYHDPSTRYGLPYPFDAQFPYPLFAAILAVPFTPFPSYIAGALYVGCLSAIMAFAVSRRGWWQLCIFLSPCYFVAASVANWSPLLVAAAFLPVLYPLAIVKPTMIAPVMANYPNARGFLLCLPMIAASLLIMPNWPHLWLASLGHQPGGKYLPPLLISVLIHPMLLILLSALWWRKRPARMLLMLACIPQHPFFYDQLLLWLIPQTLRQSLTLSAAGWTTYILWFSSDPTGKPLLAYTLHGPGLNFTAPYFYLPALAIVIWQAFVDVRMKRTATHSVSDAAPVNLARGVKA